MSESIEAESFFEVLCYRSELLKRGLQILHNLGRDHIGIWKVRAVFKALVFEPEPSRRETSETDCAKRRAKARLSGREGVNMSRFR